MIKVTKLTENLNKKQKNLLLRIIAAAVWDMTSCARRGKES